MGEPESPELSTQARINGLIWGVEPPDRDHDVRTLDRSVDISVGGPHEVGTVAGTPNPAADHGSQLEGMERGTHKFLGAHASWGEAAPRGRATLPEPDS